MTRFAHRAILVLGALSFGVLAAPTAKPLSTQAQALQSCNPPIGGLPAARVNVLAARGNSNSCYDAKLDADGLVDKLRSESEEQVKVADEQVKTIDEIYSKHKALSERWEKARTEHEWRQMVVEYESLAEEVQSFNGCTNKCNDALQKWYVMLMEEARIAKEHYMQTPLMVDVVQALNLEPALYCKIGTGFCTP
ncbi:hypothetical protein EV361DRAFT_874837 [Lentinula raphanica]|nr:hypothetical protein EV361DRAFT_874837 [Lentinula raphanica]